MDEELISSNSRNTLEDSASPTYSINTLANNDQNKSSFTTEFIVGEVDTTVCNDRVIVISEGWPSVAFAMASAGFGWVDVVVTKECYNKLVIL